MTAKTLPLKQWDVARELRRRLKRRFEQESIEVPVSTQTLVLDGAEGLPQAAAAAVGALGAAGTDGRQGPAPHGPHTPESLLDDESA
jgi:small conductance mechanosensitive channel